MSSGSFSVVCYSYGNKVIILVNSPEENHSTRSSSSESETNIMTTVAAENLSHDINMTKRINTIAEVLVKNIKLPIDISDIVVLYDNDPSNVIINVIKQGDKISQTFLRIARLIINIDFNVYSLRCD